MKTASREPLCKIERSSCGERELLATQEGKDMRMQLLVGALSLEPCFKPCMEYSQARLIEMSEHNCGQGDTVINTNWFLEG